MTRLILGSSHRKVSADQLSAHLYVIDLESRQILKKTEMIDPPFRMFDYNPRGGMRGTRGISWSQARPLNGKDGSVAHTTQEIALANYASIFCFDTHWNLTRVLSQPAISGIHEIQHAGADLWVTATSTDQLVRLDEQGEIVFAWSVHNHNHLMNQMRIRPIPMTARKLLSGKTDFRDRRNFNDQDFDHCHLNSLSLCDNGDLLVSLGLITNRRFSALLDIKGFLLKIGIWPWVLNINRIIRDALHLKKKMLSDLVAVPVQGRSAVVRLQPDGSARVLFMIDVATNPSHTVRALPDGSGIYLDTSHGLIVHFDAQTGAIHSQTKIADQFLRGAVLLPDGKIALGAGNEILIFDIETKSMLDRISFTANPDESVHGLTLLPPEFSLPPDSLQTILNKQKP